MKRLSILLLLFASLWAQAQEGATSTEASQRFLDKLSWSASFGTESMAFKDLSNHHLANINLGELNVSFKTNDHIAIGLSMTGPLGNCKSGYYNTEGIFIRFETDDHDDENDMDDDDMDDDKEDCEDGVGSVMGTFTYKLSDRVPVFIQASGGYAMGANALAYSAMVGYHQKLFSELGITAGIRFSDILHKIPSEAVTVTSSSGLKAELGLSWNF